MRYFRVEEDMSAILKWQLGGLFDNEGNELDSRDFTYGNKLMNNGKVVASLWNDDITIHATTPLSLMVSSLGPTLDVTYAAGELVVVKSHIATCLESIAPSSIELISVIVGNIYNMYIINVVDIVDCIDHTLSEIDYYPDNNDIRPELSGQPETVYKLRIDRCKAAGHDIFRIKEWEMAIVVSESIKMVLDHAHTTGIIYSEV